MDDISTILKGIRKTNGLTQKEFGDRVGLKQNTYSMIEKGKNRPTMATLKNIIKEFNLDANVFFIEALNDSLSQIENHLNIKEQLNESRNHRLKINVDAKHSKRLYDVLERKYPELYKLKVDLDTLDYFREAIEELAIKIHQPLLDAFWLFPGKFNFAEYEKRGVIELTKLEAYKKPLTDIATAINVFYEEMQAIDGNIIDFGEYKVE